MMQVMGLISKKTVSGFLALLFVCSAATSCLGLTETKFADGNASGSITFPENGGSDSTMSINLSRHMTVSGAAMDMEGIRKTYGSASGFIDFNNPGGSTAFDGTIAQTPPAGKPNALELNNITIDRGLMASDDMKAANKAQNVFPYHLFEFDLSEVAASNFDLMWEGCGNMYMGTGGNSAATLYVYNCATNAWVQKDTYTDSGTGNIDHVLWAHISSGADTYADGRGFVCFLVTISLPPFPQFTATMETDYVGLWYNGTRMLYPENLKVDIKGDGTVEWQRPGKLRGKANFNGTAFVNALQAVLDGSVKDIVNIPLKISSDKGGILFISNLSIAYDPKNLGPTLNGSIPRLDMNEDTNATALLNLRTYFKDDAGVDALAFSIVYEQDNTKVHAAMNADGYRVDFFTMTPNWYGDAGFKARATDAEGLYIDISFTVRVLSVNDPPKLKGAGTLTAYQGARFAYSFTATDIDLGVDPNELLTFSTNSSHLTMDTTTGEVSFTPVNSQVGTHLFNVTVTDRYGATDTRNFTLKIENANDPPSIAAVADQTATEHVPFLLKVVATDIDLEIGLDTLTFEDNTTLFNISSNGTVAFTPANKDVGEHQVSVSVHDIVGPKAYANFTVTVINVNDGPVMGAIKDVTVDEDSNVSFRVMATDEDAGDELAFGTNSTLVKVNATGWVRFTPTQKDIGVQLVNVTVTDKAGATASAQFKLTVRNVNDPPNAVRIVTPRNGTIFKQGELISFEGNASDDDGDPLNFTWYIGTEVLGVGRSVGTKSLKAGIYSVTVAASDGTLSNTSLPVEIIITKPATTPGKGFIPGFEMAMLAMALVACLGLAGRRRA